MSYIRQFWKDHVTKFQNKYVKTDNPDGTITLTPDEGEVIQVGTPQNQANFNNLEEGVFANRATIAELARVARIQSGSIKSLTGEKGTVKLTNTAKYPFNNSKTTVALKVKKDTLAYSVDIYCTDKNIGDFLITDKQLNGFKLEYTGGAKEATVEYVVMGGNL